MAANPRAGQPAQPEDLIDVAHVSCPLLGSVEKLARLAAG
jgi:hypothetical protein